MKLVSNPKVKTELDNLEIQFGTKAMLDLDDCCALFKIARTYVLRYLKRCDIPQVKIGHKVFVPTQDLALFLARKKAEREGELVIIQPSKADISNRRGFAKSAHEAQLAGNRK